MTDKLHNLPLFPLDIFLLVGGMTRLRIFEPRYLKMVSLSSSLGGFIISSNKQEANNEIRWGSLVEVVNFDKGDDGILEIDVRCTALVSLSNIKQDKDQLHFADFYRFDHWSQGNTGQHETFLSDSLKMLFQSNQLLNELYPEKLINNGDWVISRWLELLPIPFAMKNKFIFNSSFSEAQNLVNSIISKEI
jgi:Lon protease-like protein